MRCLCNSHIDFDPLFLKKIAMLGSVISSGKFSVNQNIDMMMTIEKLSDNFLDEQEPLV